jgi:hypothetical protein
MHRTIILLLGAAAASALPAAVGAQSLDLPQRKTGLWEITTTIEKPRAMPPIAAKMCLDSTTDRELMDHALKLSGQCKSVTTKRQDRAYVIDVDCPVGSAGSRTKAVFKGDFDSTYTVRIEGTMEGGAGKRPQSTVMTQEAQWKGADCRGMKPGDLTMFGGITVNIKQLKSLPAGLLR